MFLLVGGKILIVKRLAVLYLCDKRFCISQIRNILTIIESIYISTRSLVFQLVQNARFSKSKVYEQVFVLLLFLNSDIFKTEIIHFLQESSWYSRQSNELSKYRGLPSRYIMVIIRDAPIRPIPVSYLLLNLTHIFSF